MAALILSGAWMVVVLLWVVQIITVALGRSLRTYSRSRLELVCDLRQQTSLIQRIEAEDEITERAADTLAVVTEVFVACLLARLLKFDSGLIAILLGGSVAIFVHFLASLTGRVWAETFLAHFWVCAKPTRVLAWPLTTLAYWAEQLTNRLVGDEDAIPRPASLEVEILPDSDHTDKLDPAVPESIRTILEHVVALTMRDASEIMKPRSSMTMIPATVTAQQAIEKFGETGFSRIPVYGESRDDIVGILAIGDLIGVMADRTTPIESIIPRKLLHPAYFVPESKNANDLLIEMRERQTTIAIALDEYGGVAGLVTMDDLIETLLGPSQDEQALSLRDDRIRHLGETRYEVDAAVPVGQVNHKLHLHLPTDGKYQTVGGYAFNELGRLPSPGEMFVANGVQITILEVVERSIRRVLMEVH